MKEKVIILSIFLTLSSNLACNSSALLIENIIKTDDQAILQKTINLLLLFVSEQPKTADKILSDDASGDMSREKTAVLDAIQKICQSYTINKLKSEPTYKIKRYEDNLNRIYQRIYVKLDKRYRKILYGPSKGSELPPKVYLFSPKPKIKDPSENAYHKDQESIPLLERLRILFC